MISYFPSCDDHSTKVISIAEASTSLHKAHPSVSGVCTAMYGLINKLFQKSTENTTCELYNELNCFVRLYAANLLTTDAILAANDNITLLSIDTSSQLSNENLAIGDSTWITLAQVEVEHDIKPFLVAVTKLYFVPIQKVHKKFPFGDTSFRI